MPTGIFSLGTIATRLRAAADSSTLARNTIDDLVACAQTLEGGFPSTRQLRAILKAIDDIDRANPDLELRRCVTSLMYWVDWSTKGDVKPTGKPEWMTPIVLDEVKPVVHDALEPRTLARLVFTNSIRVRLDEIERGAETAETWDDLTVLVRCLRGV